MSAQGVLKDAADRGVCVSLNGDNLAFKATVRPPPELLANLKMHKAEIVALLRNEAAHPEPRIVREPPFGSDSVPERFIAATQALISQCPLGVDVYAWEAGWRHAIRRLREAAGRLSLDAQRFIRRAA